MNWTCYRAGRVATRFILTCTMRVRSLRTGTPDALEGGYILAVSHQGHLDPFVASTLQDRPVVWMTREEFFRRAWARWAIRRLNGFRVDRFGVPVSAIRHAIGVARRGYAVGICPEGGVTRGPEACFRGGRIKRGLASVAIHARVPIVPCILLGTARLSEVGPWLPARRGRLWVAYGAPIYPPAGRSTRAKRHALAAEVEAAYVRLYEELRASHAVDDRWVA